MNNQQEHPQLRPPNYLVWAILTTILCCLPFGIISIIFAAQVNSKWMAGDYEGAKNSSRNAKIWAWVAFGFGIVSAITVFVLSAIGIVIGGLTDVFDF